ncbi:MAG: alkaline phosphatase family protein [Elusimicrobiota bacterium]
MGKVIVIGLDGASYSMIKQNLDRLNFFKKLHNNGKLLPLKSVIPPATLPAWSSSYTGKNPANMGIRGMGYIDKNYKRRSYNSSDRNSLDVYELAGEFGKECVVLGMPITSPVRKVNGVLISGRFSIDGYPKDLSEKIIDKYNYQLMPSKICDIPTTEKMIKERFKTATEVFKNYSWDLGMLGLEHLDNISHNLLLESPEEIIELYRVTDNHLQKFVNELEDEVTVILYSDHGFTVFPKRFYGARWLRENNFLKLKSQDKIKNSRKKTDKKKIKKLKERSQNVFQYIFFKTIYKSKQMARRILPDLNYPKFLRKFARFGQVNLPRNTKMIDYPKSRAFMAPGSNSRYGSIYINRKSYFSKGTVKEEEYPRVKEKIINKLKEAKGKNGKKLISKVWRAEELYSGKFNKQSPDIVFCCKEDYFSSSTMFNIDKGSVVEKLPISGHARTGVFGALGKDISRKNELKNSDIIDIMPTILYSLGLKIPKDIDGKVMEDMFTEEYRKQNPVEFVDKDTKISVSSKKMETAEEEKVKQKLRDLGYID